MASYAAYIELNWRKYPIALLPCRHADLVLPPEVRGHSFALDRCAAVSLGLSVATTLGPLSAAASPLPSGPVDVLSAGSLQDLLQQQIGPAFQKATGYTLNDTSMGSDAIANGIKGGTLQGDVFISASPAVNGALEGAANGNWVSWYAMFGSSPFVLGYNPSSRFARGSADQAVVRRHRPARLPDRSDRSRHRPQGRPGRHGAGPGGQGAPHLRPEGHRVIDVERVPRDLTRRASSRPGSSMPVSSTASRRRPPTSRRCRSLERASPATTPSRCSTGRRMMPPPGAFVAFFLGKAGRKILESNGIVGDHPRPN